MKHRLRDTLYGDIVFGAILLVFVALMMLAFCDIVFGAILLVFVALMMLAFWLGEP